MTDVIIIGGGPAGVSAALTAMHRGKTALIVSSPPEDSPLWKAEHIDNYPGLPGVTGRELLQKLLLHAEGSGAKIMRGRVLSVLPMGGAFGVSVGSDFVQGRAVVIASGLSRAKPYPGEAEFLGAGVSYCATCDGAFFRGREVAVVGGGDTACEDALFLAGLCSKVHLIHRRDSLRAVQVLQDKVLSHEKIQMHWNSRVAEVLGEKMVSGLRLQDGAELPVSGVFVAVGLTPQTALADGQLPLAGGYIRTDEAMDTGVPGVFAAGDLREKPLRQVITAVADGAVAAVSAQRYIQAGVIAQH